MTKLKLTQAIVDKTQPQNKALIYWDQSITGFGLKVTPTGMKSYILQTRIAGREYKKTIYKADFIKLDQARNQARSLLGKIAMGENPFDETIREMNTFAKLSEAYIEEHAKKKKNQSRLKEIEHFFVIIFSQLSKSVTLKKSREQKSRALEQLLPKEIPPNSPSNSVFVMIIALRAVKYAPIAAWHFYP